jgi:hypothetical protein
LVNNASYDSIFFHHENSQTRVWLFFLQQPCAAEAVFEGGVFAIGFEDAGEAGLVLGGFIFIFAQFMQVAEELCGLVIGFGAFFLAERRDLFPYLFLTGG